MVQSRIRVFPFGMVFLGLAIGADWAGAATFYVSPAGSDGWTGRLPEPNPDRTDGPFASFQRARRAVRELKTQQGGLKEPVEVVLRAGCYFLPEPLVFEPEDSGTTDCPITYKAHPGEQVILSGGVRITGWKKPQQGNIWTAEIPEVRQGCWYFHQLFVGGQRRIRARTPNQGYLLNEGPINPSIDREKAIHDPEAKRGFRFRPGDIRRFTNLEDVNVIQFHSWTASIHWIQELDEAKGLVRFTAPADWPTGYWTQNERYYLENYPEALDSAGEWYLDRKTGLLSYWPPEGEDPNQVEVIAPRLRHLVRLEGKPEEGKFVQYIRLEDICLHHADWFIPDKGRADGQAAYFLDAAIMARGAQHCELARCEIAHVGEYAIWLGAGCQQNRIFHCHLHDLGGGGVKIGETQSPPSEALAASHNTVENSFIHDGGHVFLGAVGVWIGRSSFNQVLHNEICDLNYTGVSVGWSWGYAPSSAHHNVVEYNYIHHIGRCVLGDMGGIYTLGVSPGTRIRHNVIHDVYSPGIGGGTGIYPDEGSTGLLIENNLVYHTELGCFSQHYGRENVVRNNIFAFSRTGELARYRQEDHISFFLERNIIYSTTGSFLLGAWSNGNYRMRSNLYWDTSTDDPDFDGLDFSQWQAAGRDEGSLLADPLFVDPEKRDFRLRPGSPAERIGFTPFDPSQAGLYGEPEWVNLPKKIVRPPLELPPVQPRWLRAIQEDFEQTPVGQTAAQAVTSGEENGASIRVTDQTADHGKHSLRFQDAPGLRYPWQPHLYYVLRMRQGTARVRFAVRLEPGAVFVHEWRDAGQPYLVGPSIRIDSEGQLFAGAKPLCKVPIGEWIRLEIRAPLGKQATGTYRLNLQTPGQPARTFAELPVGSAGWKALCWLGFISAADARTTFYLDDIQLQTQ